MTDAELETLGINVIRGLAMDAPQKANSGHPGTAMALAPLAHVLFTRIMNHDPSSPHWPDRDRFVLSAGHACILLYSMLYLTGYGLELDDIKTFRQWGSLAPGHPEWHHTTGVEVTTGPLGQGFANAVGMGIAERWLRNHYGPELVNHHTFVICSDGDLEEGISHEAASLAGHLGLGRLVYVYDDNHITIDGPTELSYSDDVPGRFAAYGWHVESLGEVANDTDLIEAGLRRAMAVEDRPSLVVLRSHIGWPAPNRTDTSEAHGSPLGHDEIALTKQILGLPTDQDFWVPDEVLNYYRRTAAKGKATRVEWERHLASWDGNRAEWDAAQAGKALPGWETKLPEFTAGESVATRKALGACINDTAAMIPGLMSGADDLTGNTGTELNGSELQSSVSPGGSQVAYGIREHAMGGIMNGMAAHGGILPVGGTFFVFSDYMRGSVRLAALSGTHVIYSWTHDSIGLGEDGPTHQPIEQLAAMRAMPGLRVIRPADANECAQAWRLAVDGDGPTALILSRQGLPVLEATAGRSQEIERGAYVLAEFVPDPTTASGASDRASDNSSVAHLDLILIGTGSEVSVCLEAARILQAKGRSLRVVSMPSWDLFERQEPQYRSRVLPPGIPTLAVEAASPFGWDRYAQASVTIDHFGSSSPGDVNMEKFGFTPDHVAHRAEQLLNPERQP
ncbi:MAG: transketolase [Acidimicrobiales bacterium]